MEKRKRAQRNRRNSFPYERVAKLWARGATIAKIARTIGFVGTGDDPLHGLRVHLTRMHKGYRDADGKVVQLPHRVSPATLRRATRAGRKASA